MLSVMVGVAKTGRRRGRFKGVLGQSVVGTLQGHARHREAD
jgi:hypothetical protein